MSLLGSKSSSNILIKKRIRTGKEKNTAENQGVTHSRQQASSLYFCYQVFLPVKQISNRTTAISQETCFVKSRSLLKSKCTKKEKDHTF